MAIEELAQKYFMRDRVRNRMLKHAAELWGFSESEMDDFDPLVNLLIEACAVEFERTADEIGKAQNRMLERLAELLYPGAVAVRPAYGMIQARSSEPATILHPDAQFIYRPSGNDKKRDEQTTELFFSPSLPVKIIDGAVKFIASSRELFEIGDGTQKFPIASSSKKDVAHQHTLWIGAELHDEVESLENISFFFNWANQHESRNWISNLPYTHWLLNGLPLQHLPGLATLSPKPPASAKLAAQFDAMQNIEDEVLEIFNPQYITITAPENIEQFKAKRQPYPEVLEMLFDKKELKELKNPLLWIEVRFPTTMPAEALDSVFCCINAVPVLNRKLNKITYKLGQALNIVPLETDGTFLSVKEITNSYGQPIKLVPFANPENMVAETYTLRYGINRFDQRNSYDTLTSLAELIREESSYFSSLGEDFLIQNIRELKQVLARIEEKIKLQNKNQSPYPYLMIRPQREGANVMIEFWNCKGELANKIPVNAKLAPYRNSNVKTNSIFSLTSTYGGKDKFNDAEKIEHYKTSLLTHGRLVTQEDLKTFVQTELGKSAKDINYQKAFTKSSSQFEGFVQTLIITVTPEPDSLTGEEWQQRLFQLKLKIEKQSANNIPLQIKLA
ncbi:MAG: type VI secretion system baseplate subunit TssF [Bacteroidetes bacterium]|nr:type VI secretion system baseplate subunit TssF [Bacteroidota bacterium]